MKDNVTHIPALRFGEAYKSMDTNDLGTVLRSGSRLEAVSYTHLTLPTIYSV